MLRRRGHFRRQFASLWPHGAFAVVLAWVGMLNILTGLSLPYVLPQVHALDDLAGSLSALGGTAQIILGIMLVLSGTGLVWRLVSAWMLSVLLLIILVGVDTAQGTWDLSLVLQILLLTGLIGTKSFFSHRTVMAGFIYSMSGIFAILAYGAFGSFLLRDGFNPVIPDLGTALYFTVITLSTAGYGDIVPVSHEARWFVVTLLVIGLGVFASAIASTFGPKISSELQHLFNPRKKPMDPKNHVILIGEGSIASNTAAELKLRDLDFVQIVTAKGGLPNASHTIIEGDATNDAVLQQAGIKTARLVIAAREDDGENALIALVAKDLNPDVRLLAVAGSAQSIRRLKLARADMVFSPAAVGSRMLADLVEGNPISDAFQDLVEGAPSKD